MAEENHSDVDVNFDLFFDYYFCFDNNLTPNLLPPLPVEEEEQ